MMRDAGLGSDRNHIASRAKRSDDIFVKPDSEQFGWKYKGVSHRA